MCTRQLHSRCNSLCGPGGIPCCAPPRTSGLFGLQPSAFSLLLVQPGFDFLCVTLVVEGQQAVQDGTPGGFADGRAHALLDVVDA